MRVRSLLFPLILAGFICAAAAMIYLPAAAPPPHVVFDKVRERDDAAVAAAVRADPHAVEWRDSLGYSLLHWAAAVDDDAAVRLLLDAGADPNARNARGQTPLHIAAMSQVRSGDGLIKTLIARGASVDAAAARGVTPLQIAQSVDRPDLARALLAAGAREPRDDATDVSDTQDTRVAANLGQPSSVDTQSRRPRPDGLLRVWARVTGVRLREPTPHGAG